VAQRPSAEAVRAAQGGDRQAIDILVAASLPQVYNIVGRALNGHADVDDVVQETLIRIVRDLPALRDPDRFRGWVVAIANRQLQLYLRARRKTSQRQQALAADVPDPGSDFAARAVTELLLDGQRREVVEAARWLADDDRLLLSLWWQEASGEITRADLARALDLTPRHAAVRVKRMKDQLDAARTVTRALAAGNCADLSHLTHGWNGTPDPLWRKRLTRHVRDCPRCSTQRRGLLPAEKLLLGLLAVPLPAALATACVGLAQTGPATAPSMTPVATSVWQLFTTKTTAVAVSVAAVAGGGFVYAVHTEPIAPERPPAVIAQPPAATETPAPSSTASTRPTAAPSATARATGPVTGVTAADLFVAPDGSDTGDGSIDRPFATIGRAVAAVRPSQTIALRAGTYRPTADIRIETNGTAAKRITLSNYRNERPVIDAAGVPADRWTVTHEGDYWTVQGLEFTNSRSQAYVCVSCRGVVLQRLAVHDNVRAGILLRGPDTIGNEVLDNDVFGNHDPGSPDQTGLGIGVKFGSGSGNVLRGNRTFDNGDNGIDLRDFASPVTVERNWSWGNGRDHWNIPGWNSAASGFALGGVDAPTAAHVVRQNAAWDNAGHGFSDDENPAALVLTRNTAWRNGDAGFDLRSAAARLTGDVAVGNGTPAYLTSRVRGRPGSADFRSVDPATARGARRPDGRLPATTFLTGPDGVGADMRAL
jgi:RNA polymerase sigma factor (sigma-70 family)